MNGYSTTINNAIQGNTIGLNAAGTAAIGNGAGGIRITSGARNNAIGGSAALGEGNVISGNSGGNAGIYIDGDFSDDNVVQGNRIGTNAAGTAAVGNNHGIQNEDADGTIIGGSSSALRNIISGNAADGINTSGSSLVIEGNYIGLDAAGAGEIANGGDGIDINGGTGTTVGGTSASRRNVISGNDGFGIYANSATSSNNFFSNYIGVDAAGTTAIANLDGIWIDGSAFNAIGQAGAGNVISGNEYYGIVLDGTGANNNTIEANFVGVNASGSAAVANGADGVSLVNDAHDNTIGGATAAQRNVISGNAGDGIQISGLSSDNNTIQGNYIGADAGGTVDLGNAGNGIFVTGGDGLVIDGNLVSGNDGYGICLSGAGVTGASVTGNTIGLNAAGTASLLQGDHALYLNAAADATIGGPTAAERNVVNSASGTYAVYLLSATDTLIAGNFIGTDALGTTQLSGGSFAINNSLSSNTIVGGTTAALANVIAGYSVTGVNVSGAASAGTEVLGNFIGTDKGGTLDLTAGIYGIVLQASATGVLIGGTGTTSGNVIANHASNGIRVFNSAGSGNSFLRNRIYNNDALGIDLEGDGVTGNDADDADSGANNLQNFPVITYADLTGADLTLSGTIDTDGPLNTQYRIEFFGIESGSEDPTHGEARYYLGTTTATVDGSGDGAFTNVVFNGVTLNSGDYVTAIATRIDDPGQVGVSDQAAYGDSSEYAANAAINTNRPIAVDDYASLDFDGVDDVVNFGSDPSLEMTNTMTMEVSVRPDAYPASSSVILNKEGEYEIGIDSTGNLRWAFANADPGWTWHDTGHVLALNEWAHIAVTYDSGIVKTYVNGAVVDAYLGSGVIGDDHPSLDDFVVGGRTNNPVDQYFAGQIDEVRIWDTVRTQLEIHDNVGDSLVGNEPGLVGYWQFNEGAGATANDATANNNHGTLDVGANAAGLQWIRYETDQNNLLNQTAANGLLHNDVDPDGDPVSIAAVEGSAGNVGNFVVLASGAQVRVFADGRFDYDPNGQYDGLASGETATDSWTYVIDDSTGDTDDATATITVTGVNDEPAGADNTVATNEDADYAFTASDFGFSDTDGNSLAAVVITTLPANGTLYLDANLDGTVDGGEGVVATQAIAAADIAAGRLKFKPAANANGTGYDSFTFQVRDDGGTASGGQDTDQSPNTMTIDVAAVNDEPAGADNTVATNEDTDYAFTASDFGFSDTDGNGLAAVVMTTLPANGTLYLDANLDGTVDGGEGVVATQAIAAADLAAGRLKFKPAANVNGTGYDSFTFQVRDDGGTAGGGQDTDQSPNTMTIDVAAVNDEPAGADDTVATSEDADYAFAASDFGFSDTDGNSLAAVVMTTLPANGTLYLDADLDGTIDGGEGVVATQAIAAADIAAGRLKFKPAANANGTGYDSFTFQVRDDGGTASGGQDTDQSPNTMTIDVAAVNDEPAGADNTVATNEDIDYAFTASDFGFSDTDGNSLAAVVITTLPANGTLYLDADLDGTIDGGEGVVATQAIATADIAAGRLKFKPAANANGTGYDSFTFQVRDDGGTASGGQDTDQSPNTMTIDVAAVNDEPAGADNTVATNEDTDYAFTASDFGFSDTDGNSLAAVVMTTLPANGTLYLDANLDGTVDGGEGVVATQAIAAADIAAGRLKFKPAANANGTGYDSFTFQVRDDGGTASGGQDTDQSPNTMTIDVAAVNDEPAGADNTVATNEDTDYAFNASDFGFSDTDGNSLAAVVMTTLPANGTLYLDANLDGTIDGGEGVVATQAIAAADIAAGRLKFKPAANANGTGYDSFTFQVRDDGGTASGGQDTDQSPNTMTIDVASVNDEPAGADDTVATNEDTDYAFAASDFGFSDTDGNSLAAVVIATLPANGTLYLDANLDGTIDGGEGVAATQAIAVADIAAGRLKFKPAANANGTGYDSFTFQVRDDGGTASGGQDTDQAPNTMTIDVAGVNDEPAGADNTVATSEDTDYAFAAGDFGFSDADGNSLAAVVMTTLPANGTLYLDANLDGTVDGGEGVVATQAIAAADIAAGRLKFKPAANANGTGYDSFTFQVRDDGGTASGGQDTDQSPNTMTIDVAAVNDEPAGADNTVATNEDADYAFAASDFGFSDTDGNSLAAVVMTTLPANGTLYLDANLDGTIDGGEGVVATQAIAAADIAAGRLKFKPAANANGTGYDSFTFQVRDDGGTASGGQDTDQSPNTMTIDVAAVNDEPAGADNTVGTNEDTDYAFAAGDFGFSDADGNSLAAVVMTTLPANGTLYLDANLDGTVDGGEGVAATQAIAAADIAAGRLKFKPTANANGTGYDSFTFQVRDDGGTASGGQDTDQSPNTMTIDVAVVNDEPAGADNTVATNEDTDYAFTASDFGFSDTDGNSLAAVVMTTLPANGTLYLDANLDGTVDGGEGVAATQAIAAADLAAGRLKFKPAANANGAGYDSFTFQVRDDGGTASGGQDTDQSPNTMTIDVAVVNDEPAGADNTVATNEDTDYAFAASDFGFSDTDGNSLAAVVMTTLPANGSLYLDANLDGTVDGGEGVAATQAIAAADIAAGRLKFKPAANANGAGYDSFTFQVRDDGGTAGGGQDTDQSPNTMTIDVAGVNDEPAGADNTVGTNEDTDYAFTASDFGFSDTDGNSLAAVVMTTLPANGTLYLDANLDGTVDGGEGVVATQAIAAADLAAGRLKFKPAANANGTGYDSFTFQVRDDGGTASGGQDTDQSPNTMTIDVASVNDEPAGADNTVATNEDTDYAFNASDFGFSDTDGNSLAAVVMTTLPANGTLYLDANLDGTVDGGEGVAATQAIAAADLAAGRLKFKPAANANGTGYDSFTFQVRDDGGTASGGQDTDQSPNTMTIDVAAVNDEPTNAGSLPTDIAVAEDVAGNVDLSLIHLIDVDAASGSLTVLLTTGAGGNFFASAGGGVTVTGSGAGTLTLTGSLADLNTFLDAASNITYLHGTPGTAGNDADTIQVDVTDLGNTGSGGGGTITLGTINVDIGQVNDAPQNTTPGTQTVFEETADVIAGLSISDGDAGGNNLTTRLQVTQGVLNVTLSGSASISAGANGTNDLTILGAVTDINATLASLTYTGNVDVTGTAADTLAVVTDDLGNTGVGGPQQDVDYIQIDITNVNDAPVGLPENYTTFNTQTLRVVAPGVLANDFDVDSPTTTAVLVAGPAHGNLTLNADGSFVFQPSPAYHGSVGFTYRVFDGSSYSSPITVTIDTVVAAGDPVDPDDPGEGSEDGNDTSVPEDPIEEPSPVPSPSPPSGETQPPLHATPPPSMAPVRPIPPAAGRQDASSGSDGDQDNLQGDEELSGYVAGAASSQLSARPGSRLPVGELASAEYGTEAYATYNLDLIEHWLNAAQEEQPYDEGDTFVAGAATSLAVGLSAGYIAWTVRGAYLVAAMAGALPSWARFDPIYVLDDSEEERKRRDLSQGDMSLAELAHSQEGSQ